MYRHCWALIALVSFTHLIFYVPITRHKLTLGLATKRLRELKMRLSLAMTSASNANGRGANGHHHHHHKVVFDDGDFEIQYQEPPESYLGKFKRNCALHFGFLILVYGFMVSFSVVIL
ncbi:uncharacterized protein LOC104434738 [Eucalyptus grandis]|uniref:uncharacterized protein LOC104434738 n=1 Tax=Eucalyptus grandis TaxID=71139 RepID=UPI00192E7D35|nr:uncharacterized protein LOC104434738 [Eucalyptus grandis]